MALFVLLLAGGCGSAWGDKFMTEDRKDNGLVIILPGIEGKSELNQDIRRGLLMAGIGDAMPIYRWGRPIPLAGILLNQVDFIGNHIEGAKISNMIVEYQDSHPDRPVYLVGHSGGGGIAVFAAESLPEGHKVNGVILLSASISNSYDLTKALEHTSGGIVNFYNPSDLGLLGIGTTVMGNVDGARGPAAGLNGFEAPGDSEAQRQAYGTRLFQVQIDSIAEDSPHAASTRSDFVTQYVAPWIQSDKWPPPGSYAMHSRP